MKLSNLYKAPKSTSISLLILIFMSLLLISGKLDTTTFGTISCVVIPLMLTDALGENKGVKNTSEGD